MSRVSFKRYFKTLSHRKMRRSNLFFPKGNGGNKIFDYEWELY